MYISILYLYKTIILPLRSLFFMENLVFSYAGSDRQVHRTASHSHRGWELLYIVSGSCRIRFFPDEYFDGFAGDVFLIPPHQEHERSNLECCRTVYAVFELETEQPRNLCRIHSGGDRLIRRWFEDLPELNRVYEPLQAAALIRTILLRLDRIEAVQRENGNVHPSIKAACDYMEASLDQPIQMRDVARKAAVSQSHLNLLFRSRLGVSPLRYLTVLRMKLARRLLLDPYCTIAEVARQCGFSDVYYFTRCFSAFHHVPPGVYRRDPARFADMENRIGTAAYAPNSQ